MKIIKITPEETKVAQATKDDSTAWFIAGVRDCRIYAHFCSYSLGEIKAVS